MSASRGLGCQGRSPSARCRVSLSPARKASSASRVMRWVRPFAARRLVGMAAPFHRRKPESFGGPWQRLPRLRFPLAHECCPVQRPSPGCSLAHGAFSPEAPLPCRALAGPHPLPAPPHGAARWKAGSSVSAFACQMGASASRISRWSRSVTGTFWCCMTVSTSRCGGAHGWCGATASVLAPGTLVGLAP